LPVTALSATTSHAVRPPNSWVDAVGDRRLRGGEGARQLADRVRGDARAIRNPLRRKSRGRLAQEGKAVRESGQVPQVRATVLEEHLQHR